jgi:hypothetical protein
MATAKQVKTQTIEDAARVEAAGLETKHMTRERLLESACDVHADVTESDPSYLAELVLGLVAPVDLNGARVTRSKDGSTIFIPLPRVLWRPTGNKCTCDVCVLRSAEGLGAASFWDTLAVAVKPDPKRSDTAWVVHHPGLHPCEVQS